MNYNFNNGNQLHSNPGEVTLIIIAPRQVYDIAQRPNLFNITDGAFDTIQQGIESGSLVSRGTINNLVTEHQLMFPEYNPTVINTSSMTGCYSFILIKTLHDDSLNNSQFVITKPTKMIAIGHFSEEPITNHLTYTTSRNYNHYARLDVQSAILLKDMPNVVNGVKNVTEKVMDYLDIARNIPSMLKYQNNAPDIHRMDPATYAGSSKGESSMYGDNITGPEYDDYITVSGADLDTGDTTKVDSRYVINNQLATPTNQILDTLWSVNGVISDVNNQHGDTGDKVDTIKQNLWQSDKNPVADIHELQSDSLFLGELINRYNPKIEIINPGQASQMNIMDPNLATPNAVAATIVTQLVRPIMVELGILDIAFAYESYPIGEMRIDTLGTISPTSDQGQIEKVRLFKQKMEIEVFRLIKNVFGEFNAVVSVNSSYQTHVDIKLFDFDRYDGIMVTDNVFKSYGSPAFGSYEAFVKNATETNTLIHNITSSSDINRPYINDVNYSKF